MIRLYLTVAFAAASLAGLGLILYGALTGSRQSPRLADPVTGGSIDLGFAGEESGVGILDLDIGHEGLKHREKEAFDPGRYKPEPIESRKKIS
ncbi:exported hypothetical protein [Syntrophobacter sp. SbD1]|nr:exported hypothetical protein [Syntrophobacter sp. SbD1]